MINVEEIKKIITKRAVNSVENVIQGYQNYKDANALAPAEIVIDGDEEKFNNFNAKLKDIKAKKKEIEAARREVTKPIDEFKNQFQTQFNEIKGELDKTIVALEKEINIYVREKEQEQAAKRLAEENKAREDAEKERQRLLALAKEQESTGENVSAIFTKAEAAEVVPEMPPEEASVLPKGQHYRTTWKGKVINLKIIPVTFLRMFSDINQSKVNGFADSTKGTQRVPGVEIFEEKNLVTRS